ncbi:hypothetical protein J6590_073138 [Homalodisca vitripennis]|nr:hypothetical protein J6590_073138 [Homalodisca vitripennis]
MALTEWGEGLARIWIVYEGRWTGVTVTARGKGEGDRVTEWGEGSASIWIVFEGRWTGVSVTARVKEKTIETQCGEGDELAYG